MPLTSAEQILYTTVKLTAYANAQQIHTGTGFFWRLEGSGGHAFLLVTNKHVLEGADHIGARCHVREGDEPSGRFIEAMIALDGRGIFEHPDADLVAFGFMEIVENAAAQGTPLFFKTIDEAMVPTLTQWANLDAIEDVLMVGCPRGIFDQMNNLPIVRRGITATPLGKLYDGRSEFLVDMACFPGSSGSPVLIYDRHGYYDRPTNSYRMGAERLLFVGILYSGPLITNRGQIVLGQQPGVEVAAMMHLGQVIRSTEMLVINAMVRTQLDRGAQISAKTS